MHHHRLDAVALQAALAQLGERDPEVAAALRELGPPAPRQHPPGFATLLRIMTAQQLSTRAAAAIWARLEAACDGAVTAERFLAVEEADLRAIGFSLRKAAYGRDLARAIADGRLDLEALAGADEAEAIAAISAQKGFGRWSAEIYLLVALGRPDVFPAADLGLQGGMQQLRRLEARPDARALCTLVEPWRPWRGCGALLLWKVWGRATLDRGGGPQTASAAVRPRRSSQSPRRCTV